MADPTPDEKIAQLQQENDRLTGELAKAKAGTPASSDVAEDLTPTPTQAEIDAVKTGANLDAGKTATYKTRQAKGA